MGLAAVPPRMAPATARAGPAHRGGRGDDLGRQRRHERAAPEPELRHARHRCRVGHAARHRPAPGRRHRHDPGSLGPGRSHRDSGHRYWHHPAGAAARRESARALQLSAAQPGQRQLPGRPRPGRADQPGRGPVRHARGRHLAGRRHDLAGDRHRAEPEQPGGRVRAGRPGPGQRTPARWSCCSARPRRSRRSAAATGRCPVSRRRLCPSPPAARADSRRRRSSWWWRYSAWCSSAWCRWPVSR